ncbi:MAG: DUF1565 domain-containing protein [Ignavibacterium sp.]|nr:DUF1565 domain-containing protein [Ignavibacterium sp.]
MATYYVSSQTGSDFNNGLSPNTPFQTITKAVSSCVTDDTIVIAPGEYAETVTVPSSKKGIKFIGDPDAKYFQSIKPGEVLLSGFVKNNGRLPQLQYGFYFDVFERYEIKNITFEGFASSGSSPGAAIWANSKSSNPNLVEVIENCTFRKCSLTNIEVAKTSNMTNQFAIYFNFNGYNFPLTSYTIIRNCKFDDSNVFFVNHYTGPYYSMYKTVFYFCEFNSSYFIGSNNGSSLGTDLHSISKTVHLIGCVFKNSPYVIAGGGSSRYQFLSCVFKNIKNIFRYQSTVTSSINYFYFDYCHFENVDYYANVATNAVFKECTFLYPGSFSTSDGNAPKAFELINCRVYGLANALELDKKLTREENTVYKKFDYTNQKACGLGIEKLKPISGLQSGRLNLGRAGMAKFKIPVDKGVPVQVSFKFVKSFRNGKITVWFGNEKYDINKPEENTVHYVTITKTPVVRGFEDFVITVDVNDTINTTDVLEPTGLKDQYFLIDDFEVKSGEDLSPPAKPTGFTATAGDSQVTLTWDANTEDDLDKYYIYRNDVRIAIVDKNTTSYVDSNLTNYKTYRYHLVAVDFNRNRSDKTDYVMATPID